MPTIKKKWESSDTQIIGTSNNYVTLSGTTESFSSGVDMETNGYEGAHLIVEMNYDTSPTDDVEISLYGSLDGSNYDDTPIWTVQGDKSVDPQQLSFIIKDLIRWRIGVKQTGSTDSHDVRAYVQRWQYDTAA
jgi:hypothetical protein